MKIINIKNGLFLFNAIMFLTLFNSCTEKQSKRINEANLEKINTQVSNEIFKFKDENEYIKTQKKVLGFNIQELVSWEDSIGFYSFGRVCDQLYSMISPEEFNSKDDIYEFVELHSDYFEIIEEDGELVFQTKSSGDLNRYFLNANKVFQIGDDLIKYVGNQKIVTKNINEDLINSINIHNIENFLDNEKISISKPGAFTLKSVGPCGYGEKQDIGWDKHPTSKAKNRTSLKIRFEEHWDYVTQGDGTNVEVAQYIQWFYEIKTQKKTLGVWFNAPRTISCNLNSTVQYDKNGINYINFNFVNSGTNTAVLDGNIKSYIGSFGNTGNSNPSWNSYHCWADQPDCPELAKLDCN